MVKCYRFVESLFDGVQEHWIPSVAFVEDDSLNLETLPAALIQVVASNNDYEMVDTLAAETSEHLRVTVGRIEPISELRAKVFKSLFPYNVYIVGGA